MTPEQLYAKVCERYAEYPDKCAEKQKIKLQMEELERRREKQ